jgi:AcrR family transcriptional regulator
MTSERMARRREERRAAILAAAREIAEQDGWAAVTSRRLADAIEYTQPVIYSHFPSMDAVIDAVAVEAFDEFARVLKRARTRASDARGALEALIRAYLRYAKMHQAIYDAMFVRSTSLVFAHADTSPQLVAGFTELRLAVEPYSSAPDTMAELLWANLHGLTLLQNAGRIRKDGGQRVTALVQLIAG